MTLLPAIDKASANAVPFVSKDLPISSKPNILLNFVALKVKLSKFSKALISKSRIPGFSPLVKEKLSSNALRSFAFTPLANISSPINLRIASTAFGLLKSWNTTLNKRSLSTLPGVLINAWKANLESAPKALADGVANNVTISE